MCKFTWNLEWRCLHRITVALRKCEILRIIMSIAIFSGYCSSKSPQFLSHLVKALNPRRTRIPVLEVLMIRQFGQCQQCTQMSVVFWSRTDVLQVLQTLHQLLHSKIVVVKGSRLELDAEQFEELVLCDVVPGLAFAMGKVRPRPYRNEPKSNSLTDLSGSTKSSALSHWPSRISWRRKSRSSENAPLITPASRSSESCKCAPLRIDDFWRKQWKIEIYC